MCGDTNFCFSNENPVIIINYLVDNFLENVSSYLVIKMLILRTVVLKNGLKNIYNRRNIGLSINKFL
jgi:hypothetical protein